MIPWLYLAVPLIPFTWKLAGRALYAYFVRTTTVLPYLEHLGRPRVDDKFVGNAVVAGGRCVER
jgi:hypothetical protein